MDNGRAYRQFPSRQQHPDVTDSRTGGRERQVNVAVRLRDGRQNRVVGNLRDCPIRPGRDRIVFGVQRCPGGIGQQQNRHLRSVGQVIAVLVLQLDRHRDVFAVLGSDCERGTGHIGVDRVDDVANLIPGCGIPKRLVKGPTGFSREGHRFSPVSRWLLLVLEMIA